jgi:hypothetical protein
MKIRFYLKIFSTFGSDFLIKLATFGSIHSLKVCSHLVLGVMLAGILAMNLDATSD